MEVDGRAVLGGSAHLLEEIEGAEDVGGDEIRRARDGTVHVGFGGEMHHRVEAPLIEEGPEGLIIANVRLNQAITIGPGFGDIRQIGGVTGVGERIEIDHAPGELGGLEEIPNE